MKQDLTHWCLAILVMGAIISNQTACADMIRLQNAGELRGQLLDSNQVAGEDAPLKIRTLSGAVVEIERTEVDFVKKRSQVIEQYISKNRTIEHTIDAHWQLAEWCRLRSLKDERHDQLQLILELDPDHDESRKILGHVKHNGDWIPREEMMVQRGYVRHKNRWVTQQELDLIEKTSQQREAELQWYPKVRLWVGWVTGSNAQRKRDGIKELERLSEPNAIPALQKLMATHQALPVRMLYVNTLGNISGTDAVRALLDRYLFDSAIAVRTAALGAIDESQTETAVPMLISGLTNGSNQVVRRAALALGEMGDQRAVPALIAALVTTHKLKVRVPTSNNTVSFGRTADGRISQIDPRFANGSASAELAALARLGQLPYGAKVIPFNQTPVNTKTVAVSVDFKNAEVLSALEKLTNKSFGFNERDWHLWWSVSKT